MRRTRRDIEKIIEQTNELVAQQKELQEQRNQCKSIYESLLLDRKIDSIKSQIFDLDKDKDALFSILLKGPTRYIVDTDVWFYSDFISRYAFAKTPFDQLGFHLIYWLVLPAMFPKESEQRLEFKALAGVAEECIENAVRASVLFEASGLKVVLSEIVQSKIMSKSPPGVNLKQPNNKYTAEYRNNFIWDDDSLKFQNLDHSGSKTKNKNSIPELNSGRKLLFNEFKSSLIQIPFTNHLQLDRNHLQPRNRIIDSLVGRERATAVSLPIKPLRKRENHVKIFKPDRVPKGALPMIESGLISAFQDLRFLSKDAIQPLIYHQHQEKMVENITPMPPIAQSSSLATDKVTTRIQEFKHIEKEELFPRQTTPVDALKPLLMNEATEFYYQLLSFTGYNFAPTHTYFEFIAMNIENETFIILILQKFAEYLKNYNVDYAEIRCDIIKIWISNPAFFINMDSIDFNCAIFNESAINLVSSKSQRLKSSSKYDFSATIIQKNWRMYRQIEKYKIDTIVLRTTRRIQKIARANASKRRMKIEARERYENVYLPKYLKLNSDLKNEYAKYFKGKRTIIHFAFSPIIKKTVTCNINVGRFILCLQDPNVTLCIIVPQMNDEIYSYYYTAFESGIPLRNPMSKDRHCRVFFIVPETFKNYCTPSDEYSNSSTNLSNALLTSTLAIQKVKAIVGSSRCIMICDKVDKEEVSISAILFAPILGPTIFDSYNLRKRSEVLKILHESGIPTPNFHLISAYEDETSMVRQINHFMKESPNITQWNLHHNDQSIIDLDLIKSRPPVCVFSSKDVSESDIASILQTSNQFKGHLHSLILKSGAILEENRTDALIEVTMIVDNVGKFNILGSVEQVSIDKSNDPIGRIIPQYSMTHKQLLECCQKCASVCPKYGLIGIITLELIAWKESIIDQDDVVTRYICRNLYTRFTPSILRMLTVNVVSGLMHNHNTGELIFSQSDVNIQIERLKLGEDANRKVHKGYTRKVIGLEKEQKRYAFYSEIPTHAYAGVVSCATVFAINNDVKYDRLHRSGTLAEIFDTLEKQSIPLCCVADSVKEAMEMFVKDLLKLCFNLHRKMIDMGITGEMEGEFDVHRTTLEEYACFHFGLPAQKYDDLPLEEEKSAIASIADASKLVEKLKLRNLLEQRTISQSIGSSDKTFYNPILAAPYVATPSNEIPATEETAHARALEILTIVEYEVAELEAAMHIIEKTRLNWQEDIEYYRSITQESHELGKTLERRVTNIGSKRDSMILTMEDIISRGLVLIDDIRAQIKKMLEKRPKKETYRAEGEEIFIEPVSLPPTKEQTLKVIGAYLKDLEFDVSFSP